METLTRGYVDRSGVYAYKGYDFRESPEVERELMLHLADLVKQLSLGLDCMVGVGLIPQKDQLTWQPRRILGTVHSLLR